MSERMISPDVYYTTIKLGELIASDLRDIAHRLDYVRQHAGHKLDRCEQHELETAYQDLQRRIASLVGE